MTEFNFINSFAFACFPPPPIAVAAVDRRMKGRRSSEICIQLYTMYGTTIKSSKGKTMFSNI